MPRDCICLASFLTPSRRRPRLFFGWLVQAKFPPIAFSIQPLPSWQTAFPIEEEDDDEEDRDVTLNRHRDLGDDALACLWIGGRGFWGWRFPSDRRNWSSCWQRFRCTGWRSLWASDRHRHEQPGI